MIALGALAIPIAFVGTSLAVFAANAATDAIVRGPKGKRRAKRTGREKNEKQRKP